MNFNTLILDSIRYCHVHNPFIIKKVVDSFFKITTSFKRLLQFQPEYFIKLSGNESVTFVIKAVNILGGRRLRGAPCLYSRIERSELFLLDFLVQLHISVSFSVEQQLPVKVSLGIVAACVAVYLVTE